MKKETTNKSYELAYHLLPDLEESAVDAGVQEIENLIAQYGGLIINSQKPKKVHLSYPIRHYHYAHFGVLDFTAPADVVAKLNAQMKLQGSLLRYLVLSKETTTKEVRTLGQQKPRASRAKTAETAKNEGDPDKQKQMEKELENVLGKI